jgi:hypothetical protein
VSGRGVMSMRVINAQRCCKRGAEACDALAVLAVRALRHVSLLLAHIGRSPAACTPQRCTAATLERSCARGWRRYARRAAAA